MLRQLRKHDAHRVLKTWVNSWATSTRFHSSVKLPCLFGCEGQEDRLNHYVMCPNLFFLLGQLIPSPSAPLERIGLVHPTKDRLLAAACTFSAYHAVKRSCTVRALTELLLSAVAISVWRSTAPLLFACGYTFLGTEFVRTRLSSPTGLVCRLFI